jgi:hypothetical protein
LLIITRSVGEKLIIVINGEPIEVMLWAARVQSQEAVLKVSNVPKNLTVVEGAPNMTARKKKREGQRPRK